MYRFTHSFKKKKPLFTAAFTKLLSTLNMIESDDSRVAELLRCLQRVVGLRVNLNFSHRKCFCQKHCPVKETPLMRVAHHIEAVRVLIKAGAEINTRDNTRKTVLISAVKTRGVTPDILQLLIDAGADLRTQGPVALISAIEVYNQQQLQRALPLVQLLIHRGVDVNHPISGGQTPLACARKLPLRAPFIQLLLDAGAKEPQQK